MIAAVAFAALLALSHASPLFQDDFHAESVYEFGKFVETFKRTYSQEEAATRFQIFQENYKIIKEHNAKGLEWTMGVNQFTDLTAAEFKARQKAYVRTTPIDDSAFRAMAAEINSVPDSVDWRTQKAVTPVKDQGQCGSCWAFSTTGSLEGAYAIKNKVLKSFSEQQLVDCSSSFGNEGCNGGLMDNAFNYVQKFGICPEWKYPYKAVDGKCNISKCKLFKFSSHVDVTPRSEDALKIAVAQQPVSVAVEADQSSWQSYSGGVVTSNCGTSLDHGVLVVGYGTDSATGTDYWIVKNSWAATWGEQGYIRIKRGSGSGSVGLCGIATEPSYPVV
jgi:C1A family cysteine protease